ncbi:MAG: hypothetical protein LIO65_06115 [Odoribacter sp.]|nr:hypothetical protein [Odoribacter sp.]
MEKILNNIVSKFESICLEEMKEIRLMDRFDTKYVTHSKDLYPFLERTCRDYYIQEVNNARISHYKNIYFYTP